MPGMELIAENVARPTEFGSPTSLGIRVGEWLFVSGMMPWDAKRNVVGVGDIRLQTRQALENMQQVLGSADASLADIVKVTFYLTDIRHKASVWDIRKEMFGDHRPASTLIGVSALVDPLALLEVDAIAHIG